ncbi:MAG: right-handed parallel beta-helix repeat-containing protein [Rikenellaceae bacterium]
MNKRIYTLAIAALVACAPTALQAKDYYVSPKGNDSNAGTLEKPFKTIAKASAKMKGGDQCLIMEGVYPETLITSAGGTKKKPVVYKGYKGARVVIDATETVNGWTKHEGNIYKVQKELSAKEAIYNTLFYNGELMDIARWPNNADGDKFSFDGHRIKGGSGAHFLVEGMPDVDLAGGYFCYMGAHSGTTWSRAIDSYSNGEIHFEGVDIKKWPYTPHNPTILRNKNRGQLYVYGKLELLDHEGEWFYDGDSQTIYAMFPEGVAPKDGSVKVGVRKSTAVIEHNNVILDGIECFGGDVRVTGYDCKIVNCKIINCSQTLDGLIGISAQSETASIIVRGGDFTIENCLVEGGLACGLLMTSRDGSEGMVVHNNVFRYFDAIGIHANAVRARTNRAIITNNTIYTCGRDGISTFGSDSEIAYNDVFDCMRINNDGGVFYTVGNKDLKNTTIHHNYFHDSYGPAYADGRAAGIYLDNNSKGYDVYNNVVWNVTWSALMFNWNNTFLNFYNNTIWDCGFNMGRWANGYEIDRIRVINNYANVTSRDKIEKKGDQKEWIGTEFANNVINTESPFMDAQGRDFRPKADSYLVDKGTVIKGFSKGFKGSAPEIGAYEVGEPLWKVGASWAKDVMPKNFVYGKGRGSDGNEGQKESEDDIFKPKKK